MHSDGEKLTDGALLRREDSYAGEVQGVSVFGAKRRRGTGLRVNVRDMRRRRGRSDRALGHRRCIDKEEDKVDHIKRDSKENVSREKDVKDAHVIDLDAATAVAHGNPLIAGAPRNGAVRQEDGPCDEEGRNTCSVLDIESGDTEQADLPPSPPGMAGIYIG